MKDNKAITIRDVSKLANVSISTVSRVMNGNYPVKEEVKIKVLKAIEELDYCVNLTASSLKSNKSKIIVLVLPNTDNFQFMEIASGLRSVASENDYMLMIVETLSSPREERKILRRIQSYLIDGLVIAPTDSKGDELRRLKEKGIPIVLVDRGLNVKMEGVSEVMWENEIGTSNGIKALIENGHKKICAICAPLAYDVGKQRHKAFCETLRESNLEVPENYISNRNKNTAEAYATSLALLKSNDPPTAFFCHGYYSVRGLLQAVTELDLKIPKDLSVVGLGHLEANIYLKPQISTVEQDLFKMGKIAGNILMRMISGKTTWEKKVLDTHFVNRESIKKITEEN